MLKIDEDDGLVRIRAGGKLEGSDYDDFAPRFERIAQRTPGTVAMLIELAPDFAGWDLGGVWRDLKFDARHKDSFGRIAIVGDSKWEEWGTKLFDPLFLAEMKFFPRSQRERAEEWARRGGSVA
ncbi:STAS/SEC14 domain-containing protein [Qipengyuania sp.]|uniref:STAS/SEC14 domain-containing protein n=1 Tax=Qipengyuania sp. TaxID=2004515 RepID=UPI003736C7F3